MTQFVTPRRTPLTALLGLFMLAGLATAGTIDVRVATASDDEEEKLTDTGVGTPNFLPRGAMTSGSSDLELGGEFDGVSSGGKPQAVGMRFLDIAIPPGSTINNATLQFTADETNSEDTSLLIYGQLSPDPATFSSALFDITSRPKTTASVEWNNLPAWEVIGAAGLNQRTPDFSAVVQEIVGRD